MFPSLTPVERRVLTSLCSEIDGPAAVNGGLGAFRRNKESILRTAPGSLLWRPDDYHRDLRARLHTAISPDPSNPDRQLMIAIADHDVPKLITVAACVRSLRAHSPKTRAVHQITSPMAIATGSTHRHAPLLQSHLAASHQPSRHARISSLPVALKSP